jgi:branched-chain amino acid transport system permease protein
MMDWQLLSAQLLNGLVLGSIYALIALGYTMVWNILEFINFAHGEVYMVGAFVGLTVVVSGAPLIVGFIAGAAAAALLGVLIERLAYRPLRGTPKINLLISAIGVSIILQNSAQLIWGARPKVFPSPFLDASFQIAGININYQQIFIIGTALLLMVGLQLWIKHSMMGKALRGSAQDMEAAQLMGIPTNRIVSLTFAVGSALGAIAGILIGPLYLVYPTMGSLAGLKAFTAAVLGGIGNIAGALVGGLLLGTIESLAAAYVSSGYRDAIAFGVLILVLLFRPWGLLGRPTREKV